jgi:hypothetical protein
MYVVLLVGVGVIFLKSTYNFLPIMLRVLLTALLVSAIVETKNRTLEESGTLFDGDGAKEPVVSTTQNSTVPAHSIEDVEKHSQIFIL